MSFIEDIEDFHYIYSEWEGFISCPFHGWACFNIIAVFAQERFLSIVTGRFCLACEIPVMQQF